MYHIPVALISTSRAYNPKRVREMGMVVAVVVVVEVSFISRFRLRPLMGTRQERPGMYLSNYLVCPEIMVKQNN